MSDRYRYPSEKFAKLLLDLGERPQGKTREEVFDAIGLNDEDYFLAKLSTANKVLSECGIEVHPQLQEDPLDGIFLLRKKDAGIPSETSVRDKLSRPESASQEFKATYWCDYNRLLRQPEATVSQLKSEDVKHSALKSVAGFLTTSGGTLFIGVDDTRRVLGLEPDLNLLKKDQRNVDRLINNIKTDIKDRFRDGKAVNDYVSIDAVDMKEGQVLQLEVASRRNLSYLALPKHDHQLYRRQGNRTETVKVYEMEEFLEWRNKTYFSSD